MYWVVANWLIRKFIVCECVPGLKLAESLQGLLPWDLSLLVCAYNAAHRGNIVSSEMGRLDGGRTRNIIPKLTHTYK